MELYTSVSAMEPLVPEDRTGELVALAERLIREASALGAALHSDTRAAMAELVRPMNSYYSNLIEGHDTHPIDIERALKQDYSTDRRKRDLQMEAQAHIALHRSLHEGFGKGGHAIVPCSSDFLKRLHNDFYAELSEDFRRVKDADGKQRTVIPGAFRDCEVGVGRHIGPAHGAVPEFMARFEGVYDPRSASNRSLVRRVVNIAAAHHRLVWIHPFVDGNGRVVRLFSDACLIHEGLDASGLWSVSRGLARSRDTYQRMLSMADSGRQGDHDGRGNLSNTHLVEFCRYFLETAIDQIVFMHRSFDVDGMLGRLEAFVDRMVQRGRLRTEARFVLREAFLCGSVTKPDAERLMNLSDKTAKLVTDGLVAMNLLSPLKEGKVVRFYPRYPISISPWILPNLYPEGKEAEMMG
jgi:Fic family protein